MSAAERPRIVVREIERRDRREWDALWRGYNDFYERRIPAAVSESTWSRFFDEVEPVHALVAEQGGDVVGLVHYIFHRSTSLDGPTCYLQDLFTAPRSRAGGVGRALIEAVYERAREGGAARVYWHTHETNETAMKLYDKVAEKTGFVVYAKDLRAKR